MQIEIARHALDRVPLSLVIDDSTILVNLAYFFIRDWNALVGESRRWEDLPVIHPEAFTREFFEWCGEEGIKGKFSVIPCPAGVGRIDRQLPLVSRAQQESWLQMARELIMPNFDIHPEMMTHTHVLDLKTFKPVDPELWEQRGWNQLPLDQEELVTDYIATACQLLHNVGLTPTGVTSPGGFGHPIEFFAKCLCAAIRRVTGNPTPSFFKRFAHGANVETPVWFTDREAGTALGEIQACTGDWTGSWTGYGDVSVDKYITADLAGGRLPALVNASQPAVLCSHWQGFYGLHDDDRRGFHTLKAVVGRLNERDPHGERTCWRKPSEITTYAAAREMAALETDGETITLDLPVRVPEFTLRLTDVAARGIAVDGRPLAEAKTQHAFVDGTYLCDGHVTWLAFSPQARRSTVKVQI